MSVFEQNMHLLYGEAGDKWLRSLPGQIDVLSSQWGLRELTPFSDLSYHFVARGYQGDEPIVLKLGCDVSVVEQERNALQAFNGYGVATLLEADIKQGALLISRAIPGKTLTELFPKDDDKALEIVCGLAQKLHQAPIRYSFPRLTQWLAILDKEWEIPRMDLQRARALRDTLIRTTKTPVLLHGDLHYSNCLSCDKEWVLIDPKGVIGDPVFDLSGCLVREPFLPMMALQDTSAQVAHRINLIAKTAQVDPQRIWDWTFVQTVLSICWSLEDGQTIDKKLEFLGLLRTAMQ